MAIYLSVFYFFYFGVVGIYVIFLPKVLSILQYSSSEIGILLAASPLVRFLIPFAFTKGFELNLNRFKIALLFMLISSIAFYPSITSFYPLLLANIGLGIGMSLVLPYIEVIALDTIKKERYGKIRLFGSIGFILIALLLVNYLHNIYNAIHYLVFFVSITTIIALKIALTHQQTNKQTPSTLPINILQDWSLWISLILMQVSFGAFYNFFTIYETQQGISLDLTIYLWVFGVIVEIIMLYFQTNLLKKNLIILLEISIFATVIRWLLLYLFPTHIIMLFFSQSLHALSFALFYSAAISFLHQHYTNKILAQQFFSGLTFGFGGLLGAVGFGYLYDYNQKIIFLIASFIALLSLCCMVVFRTRK